MKNNENGDTVLVLNRGGGLDLLKNNFCKSCIPVQLFYSNFSSGFLIQAAIFFARLSTVTP
jgi:hypothetical protein